MTTGNRVTWLAMGISVLLASGITVSPAQSRAAKEPREHVGSVAKPVVHSGEPVRIRKIEGLGRRGYVMTPEYEVRMTQARSAKQTQNWGQVQVDYDTEPKWIDELTIVFYAMAETLEEGKKVYSFYQLTTRYGDVEQGRGHLAAAYLRPQTLKRYGDLIAIAVEISQAGKVVAEMTEGKMPPRWWKDTEVTGRPEVVTRAGALLERNQTPFALINIDDYEVVK